MNCPYCNKPLPEGVIIEQCPHCFAEIEVDLPYTAMQAEENEEKNKKKGGK